MNKGTVDTCMQLQVAKENRYKPDWLSRPALALWYEVMHYIGGP